MTFLWADDPMLDHARIQRAYDLAAATHAHQTRKDGTPYITHPVAVAGILYMAGGDEDLIVASLLHDTLEDGHDPESIEHEIKRLFGKHVFHMVDALTKDSAITCSDKRQSDYVSQLQNAIIDDAGVFFIKVADLLHNLSSLQHLKPHKREKWRQELIEQYLPVLSDQFPYLTSQYRDMYHYLRDQIEQTLENQLQNA